MLIRALEMVQNSRLGTRDDALFGALEMVLRAVKALEILLSALKGIRYILALYEFLDGVNLPLVKIFLLISVFFYFQVSSFWETRHHICCGGPLQGDLKF